MHDIFFLFLQGKRKYKYFLESAKQFHKYCKENRIQRSTIKVIRIIKENDIYFLKLESTPLNIESLIFRIYGIDYSTEFIKIHEFDSHNNILKIKPSPELKGVFTNISADAIIIESSLLFLIKNLITWFQKNKDNIFEDIYKTPDIKCIENTSISKEQHSAVESILKEPLSYVWGAPGTGKTQAVLSTAVISYIKAGKTVLLLAPTNNAIEQVLYGLFNQFNIHDIPLESTIRLGVPSAKFYQEYPQVCENIGAIKAINKLTDTIKSLNSHKRYLSCKQSLEFLCNKLRSIYDDVVSNGVVIEEDYKRAKELVISDVDYIHLRNKYNRNIEDFEAQLQIEKKNLLRLISKINIRKKNIHLNNIENLQCLIAENNRLNQKLKSRKDNSQSNYASAESKYKQYLYYANQEFTAALNSIPDFLNKEYLTINRPTCIDDIVISIKTAIEKTDKLITYCSSKLLDYDNIKVEAIDKKIADLQFQIDKLQNNGVKKRLSEASVIACTLDIFIMRASDWNTNDGEYPSIKDRISHIFIDEAAYAPFIKSIPALSFGKPVTLLGDHMQIPPVCEYNFHQNIELDRYFFAWGQSVIYLEDFLRLDVEEAYENFINYKSPSFDFIKLIFLDTTYRFSNNIAQVLADHIYNRKLYSRATNTELCYINAPHITLSKTQDARTSIDECNAVRKYIEQHPEQNIAIIAPYNNQVQLLRKTLGKQFYSNILTVHKAQGREWDTVIFSVTDTSNHFFVNSNTSQGKRIINTAISRAKNKVILVCDADYWMSKTLFNSDQVITLFLNSSTEII